MKGINGISEPMIAEMPTTTAACAVRPACGLQPVLFRHHDRHPHIFVRRDRFDDAIQQLTLETLVFVYFADLTDLQVRNFLDMAVFSVSLTLVKISIRQGGSVRHGSH